MKKIFIFVMALFWAIIFYSPVCLAQDDSFTQAGKDFLMQDALRKLDKAEVDLSTARTAEEKLKAKQKYDAAMKQLTSGNGSDASLSNLIANTETNEDEQTPLFISTFNNFLSLAEGCWVCPIFKNMYETTNKFGSDFYNVLRGTCLAFLAIWGTGWLLVFVLKFITILHGSNIGEFITQIFKKLGLILFISIFLSSPTFFRDYIIDVPTSFAVEISNQILQVGDFGDDKVEFIRYSCYKGSCNKVTETHECNSGSFQKSNNGDILSQEVYSAFYCMLKKVSSRLIKGVAVGAAFIMYSLKEWRFWKVFIPFGNLPDVKMLFIGLALFVVNFYFLLRIMMLMVDLVLRMSFVTIMLPVFAVCFCFKSTRGYADKGWKMLLSVLVQTISLCIFISLALALLETGLSMEDG